MLRHCWLVVVVVALLLLLVPGPAHAGSGQNLASHMTPLPSELLPSPIHLTGACSGVVVTEWDVTMKGSERTARATKLLDKWCRRALAEFPVFLRKRGLKSPHPVPHLQWSVAIIPDGYCYRCMNDRKHRFEGRYPYGDLWAYANMEDRYVYLTNQVFVAGKPRPIWVRSVVHELWHVQSYSSGLVQTFGGHSWEHEVEDEKLAVAFARYVLGH